MPADWEQVLDQREADIPSDNTALTSDDVAWGGDGWYLGPWLPEEEVEWFPEDLIDKYGGCFGIARQALTPKAGCRAQAGRRG